MNLPFLRYFKRDKAAKEFGVAVAPRPVATLEKPASERLGKTVMPNAARIVGLEPSGTFPVPAPVSSAPVAARKISLGGHGSIALGPKTPPRDTPSAAATERTIALSLADLAPHIPVGILQPAPIDPERRVLLQASEVERGMASGRPTILLRAIYQQAPELFTSVVDETDQREVDLPFSKVVEQFANFQVRDDQITEPAIPQLETPFLKVSIEDGERFGKPATPPAVRKIAAALPAVGAEVKPSNPIQLPIPNPASAPAPGAKAPIRLEPLPASPSIFGKISPNGTGGPANERVPASSGPPVPTPLPAPVAPPEPTRIPFKLSPPSHDLRTPLQVKLPAPRANREGIELPDTGPRISLPLRSVLRGMAPGQWSGPIDGVPEAARIELPFSLVAPQLSLGKVAISPAQFHAALPEEFRALFSVEASGTPVPLPLPEVLQNLPNESLQLRGDQEELEITEGFETPFSQKASEDAARMKVAAGPIAKPGLAAPASAVVPAIDDPVVTGIDDPGHESSQELATESTSNPPGSPIPTTAARTALQLAFDTDEPVDAKGVVARVSRLAGISSCAVVFSDGLSLAGNIPAEHGAEALCAIAPVIMQRINEQIIGAHLGALTGLTLFCAKTPVSFFAHDNICLAVLHAAGELAADTRTHLGRITQALARMYASQPND